MLTVGNTLPSFRLRAAVSLEAGKQFQDVQHDSYAGKWLVLFAWPLDFTFVCPTEIVAFDSLVKEFADRDCVVLGGSTDNEFCKLAWRREHPDLANMKQWAFADTTGSLVDALGVREASGVAFRATYLVDPNGVVQHVSVNNLSVGRNPDEILRLLDAFQTDELCPCNRAVGGATLAA